jgi:hypothetical protein
MPFTLQIPLSPTRSWRAVAADWGQRLVQAWNTEEETVTTITVSLDGLESVREAFGEDAVEHVHRLMLRHLRSEASTDDLIRILPDGSFEVELATGSERAAEAMVVSVRAAFAQSLFDAGYHDFLPGDEIPMSLDCVK